MPVEVLGIESMPNAGDPFQVTESEKEARAFAAKRQELKRFEDAKAVADLIEAKFPRLDGKVQINSIGTTIGAHTGPGMAAITHMGKVDRNGK